MDNRYPFISPLSHSCNLQPFVGRTPTSAVDAYVGPLEGAAVYTRCESTMRATFLLVLLTAAASAQDKSAGQRSFETRCAICHGGDGHGTDRGPAIYNKTAARDNQSITSVVRGGLPGGMPAFQIADAELADLTAYLRTLQPAPNPGGRGFQRPVIRETITLTDNKTLNGVLVANGL